MNKNCKICKEPFQTKDSRQGTCGKTCADKARAQWKPPTATPMELAKMSSKFVDADSLPPVEALPATYVKRCYDFWATLIGRDDENKTRIA